MLQDWDKRFPGRIETMFQAMQNIVPSHMVDKNLFDFAAVSKDRAAEFAGDTAFDKESVPNKPVGLLDEDDEEQQNGVVVQRLEISL